VPAPLVEPAFTRREALRTPAFWLLSLYTLAVFPVQAGISLHQAPYLIERGLSPAVAATIVSTFSLLSAASSLGFGLLTRRIGVRIALVLAAVFLGVSALLMLGIGTPWHGYAAACCFGLGIGGVLTVLPIAWADYFGRQSFGAIRGVALTVQVTAQASGPLLSGLLRDVTGDYFASLYDPEHLSRRRQDVTAAAALERTYQSIAEQSSVPGDEDPRLMLHGPHYAGGNGHWTGARRRSRGAPRRPGGPPAALSCLGAPRRIR
jgi:hypothetical protein